MITRLRQILKHATPFTARPGLCFNRPLLLFQSDDWGRVGVRDHEGRQELRTAGIDLGESVYDCYSLETAEDATALIDLLKKHRDSVGRNPSMVMNFVMANVDFDRALESHGEKIPLIPLTKGWPTNWRRPHLMEAYRRGIEDGIFFPALHGLTHFCEKAVSRELANSAGRADLVRKMWRSQTPYIYWRMPWIGYEYWDGELDPERRFLPLEEQRTAIRHAVAIFREFFGSAASSACAPGYRANADTHAEWFDCGIRVAQSGPHPGAAPCLDEHGMLHTFRTVEMEPAIGAIKLEKLINDVESCFRSGIPAMVSIHSINFHSSIRDFRSSTLALLDEFLTAIRKKWPRLLYLNDADLHRIATEGSYFAQGTKVEVRVARAA